MKRLSQARNATRVFLFMAVRTALIFRGLVFQFFSVLVNMVAFVAVFYLGLFVVFVMPKNGRRTLPGGKPHIIYDLHILL
jgi:hypothetical protein